MATRIVLAQQNGGSEVDADTICKSAAFSAHALGRPLGEKCVTASALGSPLGEKCATASALGGPLGEKCATASALGDLSAKSV